MLDFGLIVVIHGQRGIEQRGEQVCTNIADLGGIAAQALENINHQRVVQSVEASLHLRQRDILTADPHRRLRGAHCIGHQPYNLVYILGVKLLAKEMVLDVFLDLFQIFASIHPPQFSYEKG